MRRARTQTTYDPNIDVDTNEFGTAKPFEPWEGDHTALVHVLWHGENSGWIARRPAADQPLRRAIWDRLFNRDTDRDAIARSRPYAEVIDDLRAILDVHADVDGRRLERDEVPEEKRHESDGIDMTASALGCSRAMAAIKAYARRDALKDAANYFRDRSEEKIDRSQVIRLLDYLAAEQIGD